MNILNIFVIYAGLLFGAFALIRNYGGLASMIEYLPAEKQWAHPFAGIGLPMLIFWYVTSVFSKLGNQSVIHTVFSAKNAETARRGYILAGVLVAPIGLLSAIFGISAHVAFPTLGDTNLALPMAVTLLNPVVSSLTLLSIFAAVVSTAVATLLSTAAIFAEAFPGSSNSSVKPSTIFSKLILLAIVIVTFFIAFCINDLLNFGLTCASLLVPYTLLMLAIMFWPAFLRRSSMVVTMSASIAIQAMWMSFPNLNLPPVVYAHILSAVACMGATSVIDKRSIIVDSLFVHS